MFRRSPSTASSTLSGLSGLRDSHRRRAERRAHRRDADDDAALRARVERAQRRLAQVGAIEVTPRRHAIDNDAARRDPMTRPFSVPADGPRPARRRDTMAMARPA